MTLNHATKTELAKTDLAPDGTSLTDTQESSEFLAFPLTPGQAAMWRADRNWPGCSLYNASFRWSLTGPLDRVILERSFNEILRRHESLRASFHPGEAGPVQLIAPVLEIKIAVEDLRFLEDAQRDAEMDRICTVEAKRSFDLLTAPLIRVGLLRMEDERYVLTLTLHHIVIDGWSVSLLMEELQAIYTAFARSEESPLPEPAIQFGDYVIWHEQWIAAPEIRQQLDYWKKKLEGYRRLEVASDFPRTAERPRSESVV